MVKPTKRLKVAAPASLDLAPSMNWDKCCLCQSGGSTDLRCPALNPIASKKNAGYITLACNLEQLKLFPAFCFSSHFTLDSLDEGGGICETLIKRQAKWHKSCVNQYLSPRFEILVKTLNVPPELGSSELPSSENDSEPGPSYITRSAVPMIDMKEERCFICSKPSSWNNPLRKCATDSVNENIRESAEALQEFKLKGMIYQGDMSAQEGKYHPRCLARLYNQRKRIACQNAAEGSMVMCEGIAFANLVLYIQAKIESCTSYVFKMGDLIREYNARMAQLLSVDVSSLPYEHTTRMRQKILAHFPELQEQKAGREYVLLHSSANILHNLDKEDQDEDALAFQRFAKNLRKEISSASSTFSGTFETGCEEACIPPALLAVVNMIMYGSTVREDCRATRPALTVCQLIMLNHHETIPKGQVVRHKKHHDQPFPLYVALSTYGRTRSKGTIDELHRMGVSVSYNRVMEVTSQLSHMVVRKAKEEKVLCPSNLKSQVFTVSAIDNVDHNPSSSTSEGAFHGTGISIFQLPITGSEGLLRSLTTKFQDVTGKGLRSIPNLPEFYALVPEYTLREKQAQPHDSCPSEVGTEMQPPGLSDSWHRESGWLGHVHEALKCPPDSVPNASWAAYHAIRDDKFTSFKPAIVALLPLFHEKSTSVSMIRHGMDVVRDITKHVNGTQIPVLCADQPLYALGKLVQWNWPSLYGETRFVMLLGPFHIEQAFLRVLGQFLEGSGWIGIVCTAGITTAGSAEAHLKVTHVKKAREMHQVTAASLHSLLLEAYENGPKEMPFDEWIWTCAASSPTFKYWLTVLCLEVVLLSFVKAVRQGDFELFKESIRRMLPWFFVFDHTNYSRWLSVHLKDLEELEAKAPEIHRQFNLGNFVVRKTGRPFSALGVDQAHEQNNATVKGSGGAVGLTQDRSALMRWMIAGPEITRLLREFQSENFEDSDEVLDTHHEQYPAYQRRFLERCAALKESFLQLTSPFECHGPELIALDTRVVVSDEGVSALYGAEATGTNLFTSFVQERLVTKSKSLHDTIKKVHTKIFAAKKKPSNDTVAKRLQTDVQLFSRLFIVSTGRDLDLDTFFRHENQACPPSLSRAGEIRPGDKADLVTILEGLCANRSQPHTCDGLVYDGPALVHAQRPRSGLKTFQEYASHQLTPHVSFHARELGAKRVDLVWDLYHPDSIKNRVRETRGTSTGVRRQDLPSKGGALPRDWADFLRNAANKADLFRFLAQFLLEFGESGDLSVVTNVDGVVLSSGDQHTSLQGVQCEGMEEADGRIIAHVRDMVQNGAKSVVIRCSDTDVLVLAVSYFYSLQRIGLKELWVLYGTASNRRYIPVHDIAVSLGDKKSIALRGFHAFSGCDTVSYFSSRGKKSAWNAWVSFPEATSAFLKLATACEELPADVHATLERYTVVLYDGKSCSPSTDEARKFMFASENKALVNIPPTSAALKQHAMRAAYQAGQVWGRADTLPVTVPSPSFWGWLMKDGTWKPKWTELPDIWEACRALDLCGCRSDCGTNRCSCRRGGLQCIIGCRGCRGNCSNASSRLPSSADQLDPDDPNGAN